MDLRIDMEALTGSTTDPDFIALNDPAAPGSPTEAPPLHGGKGRLLRVAQPPVLVLGSAGGSGASTTALGLAAAVRGGDSEKQVWPIAVDATACGGDLAVRGADAAAPASSLQVWLEFPAPYRERGTSAAGCAGRSSSGAAVLPRTGDPLPGRQSFVSVHRDLVGAGWLPVYDGGAPVSNKGLAPLLADPTVALVITVAARADAVNRLRAALKWLDDNYGHFHLADAVLVVTQQHSMPVAAATEHVRAHLGKWVRAVTEIPFDLHLAEGGPVSWHRLTGETRAAYARLLGELR
ncbi:MinD/ParA family protein [Nocardia sp. NPDC059239]|uniref:MinD/ParA family ATP-binding protein n=1 Tax=Nocardia sp. NPDC059239 TaxID=3346785 RepID=UPI0036C54B07